MLLVWSPAHAEPAPELGVVWGLTVDGAPVGTREVRVRYEGESGERVRMVEAWTELAGGRRRRERFAFQERLTANSHEGAPASFHAVSSTDGRPREVQARFADGAWHVTVTEAEGEETYTVNPSRIDLSMVDLLDPESDRRLAKYDSVRILSTDVGQVLQGDVIALGPLEVSIGGEVIWTEGFELRTGQGSWRYWYASNGFLVRYEEPRFGRAVLGTMLGAAPRAVDEFQVPSQPMVEEIELP